MPGIAQQFNKLGTGEVTIGTLRQVIGIAVAVKYLRQVTLLVEGGATTGCYLRQFGETGNFQSPCLVIGEMELDDIKLIVG